MTFAEEMKSLARAKNKRLVLPEGTEPRTIEGAAKIMAEGLAAEVVLLGDPAQIKAKASEVSVDLSAVTLLDPTTSDQIEAYAAEYHELRKKKGISMEEAQAKIVDPLHWGAMMVRLGDADAMVAGAENSTGKVLVAAFTIIKTAPGINYASSCFIMCTPAKDFGVEGKFIFGDCATIPNPTAEQLAEIAIASAKSCETFLKVPAETAMLSFSTKGSAEHELVDKVREALAIAKEKAPELSIDGELQLDAAIVPSVGASKAPGSTVAGKANTLIFPDLQAGNIGYKLVQRLAGAEAYGPVLQGFAKPVSDLSRGCSVEDIVVTSAMTLAQAE